MTIFDSIILSIVEGITEFLPISSTGHLVLAAHILQIQQTEFVKSFEIIIQFGAILAVVFLYWRKFLQSKAIWKKILVAFIPTGIIGFLLYKVIRNVLLGNASVILITLFIGGVILIILELVHKEKSTDATKIEDISFKNAVLIGVFQSISVIPGVSRAAATIIGALLLGTKRKTAVEFSFLLAVPTMLAASGLDLVKNHLSFSGNELLVLVIGFIGSFIVATIAIKFFINFIQKHTFIPFGIYRIVAALLYWIIVLK